MATWSKHHYLTLKYDQSFELDKNISEFQQENKYTRANWCFVIEIITMVAETLISVSWELKSCKIQQAVQKFYFFQLPILGII